MADTKEVKELKKKVEDLESRFKRRTIAYGICRKQIKEFEKMAKILTKIYIANMKAFQQIYNEGGNAKQISENTFENSKVLFQDAQLIAMKLSNDPECQQIAEYIEDNETEID